MTDPAPNCARCGIDVAERSCTSETGRGPEFCPMKTHGDLVAACLREYDDPGVHAFARQASLQEAEGYSRRELGNDRVRPAKPRIEEIIEFSRKMNYRRLGLAFCIGLRREAKVVEALLAAKGFETVSAGCKVGRVPKETLGLTDDQKIAVGKFEAICNPILQAMILNREQADFNVLLGLCVGHDSLFIRYAEAPVTVLAVKDRLLGHNPLAAVYNIESYYRALK